MSSGKAYVSSHNVNMLRNAKAREDQGERERERERKKGCEIKDNSNLIRYFSFVIKRFRKVTEQTLLIFNDREKLFPIIEKILIISSNDYKILYR